MPLVLRAYKVKSVLPEPLGHKDHKDHKDTLVPQELLALQVQLDHKDHKDPLVQLDHKDLTEPQD